MLGIKIISLTLLVKEDCDQHPGSWEMLTRMAVQSDQSGHGVCAI